MARLSPSRASVASVAGKSKTKRASGVQGTLWEAPVAGLTRRMSAMTDSSLSTRTMGDGGCGQRPVLDGREQRNRPPCGGGGEAWGDAEKCREGGRGRAKTKFRHFLFRAATRRARRWRSCRAALPDACPRRLPVPDEFQCSVGTLPKFLISDAGSIALRKKMSSTGLLIFVSSPENQEQVAASPHSLKPSKAVNEAQARFSRP